MQNSQDFSLPVATLTTGKENSPGSVCASRELVTISQKCRFGPTFIQEKTLRKCIVHASVRRVKWRTEGLENRVYGEEIALDGGIRALNVVPAEAEVVGGAARHDDFNR
jgi:hypothetical protein